MGSMFLIFKAIAHDIQKNCPGDDRKKHPYLFIEVTIQNKIVNFP